MRRRYVRDVQRRAGDLGVPILKPLPPGLTFAVVWQPELPQSGGGLVGGM